MNLLLDTHAFLWWIIDSRKLSRRARKRIADGRVQLFWSSASSWELGIKFALGRVPLPEPPAAYLPRHLAINGVRALAITDAHAYQAAGLPPHHADPFDRMLVAQAQVEGLCLVSGDPEMRKYDVPLAW